MVVWNITNNRGSSYNASTKETLIEKYMQNEDIDEKELIRQFCNSEYHINKIDELTGEVIAQSHLNFDGVDDVESNR